MHNRLSKWLSTLDLPLTDAAHFSVAVTAAEEKAAGLVTVEWTWGGVRRDALY